MTTAPKNTTFYNVFNTFTFLVLYLVGGIFSYANGETSVTLKLKWFHQFQFSGYYAAQKQGFYSSEGLNVTIEEFSPGTPTLSSVKTGQAEFGIADASLVLSKLKGADVVALAAIFQQSPLALMALSDSGIVSPLDLIGKKVMSRHNVDDAVITAMFVELGIKESDYIHVPHTFNDDELIKGNVDAMSVYMTDQPFYYQQQGVKVNFIQPANYGIDFYGDMLFTSKEFLLNNIETVQAFRRASLKGWQYALENSEELIDWMLVNLPIEKSKEQLMYEAEMTKRMIKPTLIELGTLNKNRFVRIADIYHQRHQPALPGNLDDFLYFDLINPQYDYQKWLYFSWLGGLIMLLIACVFWGINKRLKVLVAERTYELEKSKKALDRLVITDELTKLGNRRKLNQYFEQEQKKAARYHRPLSLILFDIDYFKKINDRHGHSCGDVILIELAELLKLHIGGSDLVGRWGGEEFMIICSETNLDGAVKLAELLRETIQNHIFHQDICLTCSFGISQWQEDQSYEALFSHCDKALYKAKESGRNQVVIFNND
jgi:diguanylate cyclase (GGDEF)-like protein